MFLFIPCFELFLVIFASSSQSYLLTKWLKKLFKLTRKNQQGTILFLRNLMMMWLTTICGWWGGVYLVLRCSDTLFISVKIKLLRWMLKALETKPYFWYGCRKKIYGIFRGSLTFAHSHQNFNKFLNDILVQQ